MVLSKETSLFMKDSIADDIGEAVASAVSVYMRKNASQTAPSKPTASTTIGTSPTTDNAWEYVMPYPKKNFKFYTCEQYTKVDGTKEYSDVHELSSETYISKWVHDADATYIDGGSLYTNSVTADKIQAGAITIGKLSNDALYNVIYTVSTEHAVSEYPYIKLCTIQTVKAYQNKDVVFSISSRLSRMDTEINWAFNNSSSATASVVSHAYKTGSAPVFYASEGNGKYGIYVSKADKYENLQVHDLYNPFPSGITIEWIGTEVASLPSGYVAFTELAGSRQAEEIDEAAKTATTYITEIDQNGIKVHALNNVNSNYSKINADGLTVYRGGTDVANFGATARIGTQSGARAVTTPTGLDIYNSSNQKKASYGSTQYIYGGSGTYPLVSVDGTNARLMQSANNYANVNSSGLQVYQGGSSVAEFGGTARIGKSDARRIELSSGNTGLSIMDENNNPTFAVIPSDRQIDEDGYIKDGGWLAASGTTGNAKQILISKRTQVLTIYVNSTLYVDPTELTPYTVTLANVPSSGTTIAGITVTKADSAAGLYQITLTNTNSAKRYFWYEEDYSYNADDVVVNNITLSPLYGFYNEEHLDYHPDIGNRYEILNIISGTNTIVDAIAVKWGQVVSLLIKTRNPSTVNAQSNIYFGHLQNQAFWPATEAPLVGFWGARPLIGKITPTGEIQIRNTSSSSISSGAATATKPFKVRGTYVTGEGISLDEFDDDE